MNRLIVTVFLCLLLTCIGVKSALAQHHAHTHIGRNQNATWGDADDDKLWFFSMPGTPDWPNWGKPLPLLYDSLLDRWVCEDLYCWHSAHPEHGNWQLGGTDEQIEADWEVGIERVSFSSGFEMYDMDTLAPVLENDGATFTFPRIWMDDKYNENGTLGAWGFHHHQLFAADATGLGETFTATFRAYDTGTTGFGTSDDYTMTFVTAPEPATMVTAVFGACMLLVRRRRKRNSRT